MLHLVSKERDGEAVPRDVLKACSKMLAEAGTDVYGDLFERPMVAMTVKFFENDAQVGVSTLSCAEYLRKVRRMRWLHSDHKLE
jgi:hypothetical protein